ncbi:MAG: hypothetical protein P1V81_18520, partial [Planctomycetota bacterium]|nr:hypothetical protein [Planctomycetota bacterium]
AEQKFQDWLQVLSGLAPELVPDAEGLLPNAPEVEPEAPIETEPGLVRAQEMAVAIRNLLHSEQIGGLDLLEPGRFDGEHLGPVVFRTLDDRGRLTGSISAARLRLEAGVSARTVTLVLEDGRELSGGVREPFAELRLPFVRVDPRPWIELLPELFAEEGVLDGGDDGRWDVEALRGRLNTLLGLDASAGFHRLRHIGGVDGNELLDLHLVEHDKDGKVKRHLFADRAQLGLTDTGAVISLGGCVAVRGEEKRLFPGGKLRLFLPHADHEQWRGANLPGLIPE